MKNKQSRFKKLIDKTETFFSNPSVKVGIIVLLLLVVIVLVIYKSEEETNSRINSLFDAIWYTIVTITTVGYGDITPASVSGRISAMLLLIVGVAIFGILSGKFRIVLVGQTAEKRQGAFNNGQDEKSLFDLRLETRF